MSQEEENILGPCCWDNDKEDEEKTKENEDSCEEYALISALTGSVSPGNDTWLVDSCASKHMTGYKDSLSFLVQKDSPHKVMLGDDSQYPIKGMGEATYKLDSRKSMKMKDVLYVSELNKKPLSMNTGCIYTRITCTSSGSINLIMMPRNCSS